MANFWEEKTLSELSPEQWEQLCDGCARCCLVKLEDEESGEIYHTDLACKLLDVSTCRCSQYEERHSIVDDCIQLDLDTVQSLNWLPDSCGYRCIAEGRPLPVWHPLLTGNREIMHDLGASMKDRVIPEQYVHPDELEEHIVQWVD